MPASEHAIELDLTLIDDVLKENAPVTDEKLIPLLQAVQELYGYLPEAVIVEISHRTKLPASRMYGVATFYEQFNLEPRGRHIIKCCRGTACHVKGAPRIQEAISELLNVEEGGTTEDRKFTFETVACLGTCFLAPVAMIDDEYFGNLTPQKLESILKRYE